MKPKTVTEKLIERKHTSPQQRVPAPGPFVRRVFWPGFEQFASPCATAIGTIIETATRNPRILSDERRLDRDDLIPVLLSCFDPRASMTHSKTNGSSHKSRNVSATGAMRSYSESTTGRKAFLHSAQANATHKSLHLRAFVTSSIGQAHV